ncbi:MAG: T9SS type A sorting domain-containing protein [Fimbriimonadaceae bacterium]|nr:T9SS type A sorting domain-containing protein [Chitinophagales bacterium]
MRTTFELQVIQPHISACHENWDTMLPHEKGAFCNNCNKIVHDLSNYSQKEFHDFLLDHEEKDVCGKVKAKYIEQPFSLLSKKEPPGMVWFAVFLFVVFGMTLFSCNEKEYAAVKLAINNSMTYEKLVNNFNDAVDPQIIKTGFIEIEISTITECGCDVYEEIKIIEPQSNILDDIMMYDTLNIVEIIGNSPDHYWLGGISSYVRYVNPDTITFDTIENKEINIQHFDTELKAYPNPSRSNVTIEYEIAEDGFVLLSVFNMNGQKIGDLISDNNYVAGKYTQQFNVSDLPGGNYILLLLNNESKKTFQLSVID